MDKRLIFRYCPWERRGDAEVKLPPADGIAGLRV